jgi:hypothetical protein
MSLRPYTVQAVGEGAGDVLRIEAYNAIHAVAQAASCDVSAVCLPIWRVPERATATRHPVGTECYMPRDDSDRQWLVREAQQ